MPPTSKTCWERIVLRSCSFQEILGTRDDCHTSSRQWNAGCYEDDTHTGRDGAVALALASSYLYNDPAEALFSMRE